MKTTLLNVTTLRNYSCLLLAAIALLSWSSCTDPITVGSDLLEDDRIDVAFNGEVPIQTRTIQMDTFNVYDAGSNSLWPRGFSGAVNDPIFGNFTSGINLYFRPNRSTISNEIDLPEFIEFVSEPNVNLDSVVIILGVDTTSFYNAGIEETTFDYELHELTSQPDFNEDILLTQQFARGDLASDGSSFILTRDETLLADTTIRTDSLTEVHQRFRLNDQFIQRLGALNTTAFASDSTFADEFPGFFLQSTGESEGIFNWNLSNNVSFDGMIAYYTDTVGNFRSYPFQLIRWLPSVSRDRSASTAEMLLGEDPDNELTLVESAAGLLTEIELTDLTEFDGQIINQAQLEIYPADIPGFDTDRFPYPQTLMVYAKDEDGRLELIDDLSPRVLPNASLNNIRFFVGGVLDEDDPDGPIYRINLTVHLQRILNNEADRFIYIAVLPRISDPSSFIRSEIDVEYGRLPLNGPTASERPMRFRVAYTRL